MINFDDYANENNGIVFKKVQELLSYNQSGCIFLIGHTKY